ncbi:MAG: AsmA family protein [Gammaproteobacteria bacterium]
MKRLFLLILVFVSLAVAASIGGYLFLSSQDHDLARLQIQEALGSAIGRDVTISGPLTVNLGLVPTVRMSDIKVANTEWATSDHLLTIEELSIQPRLLPLLHGNIVLDRLTIQGVDLRLENDRSGRPNWVLSPRGEANEGDIEFGVKTIVGSNVALSYLNSRDGSIERVDLSRVLFQGSDSTDPLTFEATGEVEGMPLQVSGSLGSVAQLTGGSGFPVEADMRVGDTSITATGTIADQDFRDFAGTRFHLKGSGRRPALLLDWTDLPIPEVGRFVFELELQGEDERLAVENLDARLSGGDFEVAFQGRVADLKQVSGLSLNFSATGRTLTELVPDKQKKWPEADDFSIAGKLSGDRQRLSAEDLNMALSFGAVKVLVQGRVGDVLHGRDLALVNRISGRDFGALGDKLNVSLPDIDYADVRFNYSGLLGSPAVSDVQASLRKGDIEAEISGDIEDVVRLAGLDLHYRLEGGDLDQLSALAKDELPITDRVLARGTITGARHDLKMTFEEAQLELGDLSLTISGEATDLLDLPQLNLESRLSGRSLADVDLGQPDIVLPVTDSFTVNSRVTGPAISPNLENVDARASIGDIRISATGRLENVFQVGRLNFVTHIDGSDLSRLGQLLGEQWLTTNSFSLSGRASGTWQRLAIDGLKGEAKTSNSSLSVSGRIGDLLNTRDVDIRVHAVAASAHVFLPWKHPIWGRLGTMETRFQLSGGPDHFDIKIDDIQLGKSRLSGDFDFTLYDNGGMSVRGAFKPGTLDITPWLAGTDSDSKAADNPTARSRERIFSDDPLPLEWMDDLTLNIQLDELTRTLGTGHLDVTDGDLVLASRNLSVEPFGLRYLGTGVSGGLTLDARQEPELRFRASGLGFDLGNLTRRAGLSDTAQGRVDLQLSFKTSGHTPGQMASSANGRLALLITEGLLPDTNLPLHFVETFTRVMPGADRRDGVHILCGMVDMPVDDGVARSNVLVLDTKEALIKGDARVNLHDETMRIRLAPTAKHARAMAHNVDVEIHGNLRDPEIQVNTLRAAGSAARAAGRFALLGPLGLFVSTDTFRDTHQDCAETLKEVEHIQ